MIYYKEEKKKLVIPSGFVMIPIDCDEAIEQAREDGYREGFADGSSATCDTEEGTYSLTDDFDGEETVFPSEGKTGFNKIVIVDDGYGDAKYDEGYADGIAECSGSTCNIQPLKSVVPQFDNYPIDYQMDIYPDEGYDGLGSVSIDKRQLYDQGYQAGLEDCSGSSCNLQSKSVVLTANTQTVSPDQGYDGMDSVSIDANTYAQEMFDRGYDSGYEDAEEEYPRIQILKQYTATTTSAVIVPDQGYDGMGKVSVNMTPVFNQGYQSGYTAASGVQIQAQKTYSLDPNSDGTWTAHPDGGYDGVAEIVIKDNVGYGQRLYTSGYSAGLAACSGGCNLSNFIFSLNGGWGGSSRFYPQDDGVDGYSEVYIYDNGYGNKRYRDGYEKAERDSSSAITESYQSGYTEGYNAAITANCGTAIEEAYESGVTGGYIDSSKVAYFNQPAWVETSDSQYYAVGDTLDMVFTTGESDGTLHLLGNIHSGHTENGLIEAGIAIDFPYEGGLSITISDVLGASYIWHPFYSVSPTIHRNSGDTYHLIFKTSDAYWASQGKIYMQVTLINESRFNDVYSASATGETIHFSSGAVNTFVINGIYDENSGLYGEMNSELKIKSLKVYKPVETNNPVVGRLNSNLIWKDGELFDTAAGGVLDARIYDQGVETNYYLPSADDELLILW